MGGTIPDQILNFLIERWTYGRLQCVRTGKRFISRDTGLSILHGLALFPLILLALGSFLPIQILFKSESLIYSGAAIVAIFSMLEHKEAPE